MPKCKNDPKKSYKGTEPSPKGLGYCAHGEKEGKIRKGKDGNKWIIKKIKNGSKRWMKVDNIKKLKEELNKLLKLKYINYGKNLDKFSKLFNELSKKDKTLIKKIDDRIIKNKMKRRESFKVESNKMIISDPGYIYPDSDLPQQKKFLGVKKYKVEKGNWEGFYYSWITKKRPNIVVITNKKYKFPSKKIKYKQGGIVAVDTAQLVIVDISKLPDNEKNTNKWYKNITNLNIKKNASKIDGGYCFDSGWGDGFYNYTVGRVDGKVVQFIIRLIP